MKKNLTGWGRYPTVECTIRRPHNLDDLEATLQERSLIARGLGRAYGDSALNRLATIDMTGFSRMLAFDAATGILTVEAGVSLADIIEVFLPRGWFPPVTPGTKFVTIGGMIAADVHGKNHHRNGSFGRFVEWIDLLGSSGEVCRCSANENRELFEYTIGGMGLTGVIVRAAFRMIAVESGWIREQRRRLPNLAEAMMAFEDADQWTYSAAWIDCLAGGEALGRSILILGEHARADELGDAKARKAYELGAKPRISIPFDMPSWVLGRYTMRIFNELYYRMGARHRDERLTGWDGFFYPLDGVHNWNRLYGRRGLLQFQCVIPLASAFDGLSALLRAIFRSREGSFLAVLKRFGAQESLFSFPMEGYTLALDFPVNDRTLRLLETLDEIVVEHGGRFYLAKDGRIRPEILERADKRVSDFRQFRDTYGVRQKFVSEQSERLSL
ncbi:MAG: decaprenylphospho-beta-D-ribofuranose 2-oxidase [Paracoccaceae bacterium]